MVSIYNVKEGVIAAKIAAHAADIARGLDVRGRDDEISKARKDLDWNKQFKLAIDKEKAKRYRKESKVENSVCTMCGKYCSLKS